MNDSRTEGCAPVCGTDDIAYTVNLKIKDSMFSTTALTLNNVTFQNNNSASDLADVNVVENRVVSKIQQVFARSRLIQWQDRTVLNEDAFKLEDAGISVVERLGVRQALPV